MWIEYFQITSHSSVKKWTQKFEESLLFSHESKFYSLRYYGSNICEVCRLQARSHDLFKEGTGEECGGGLTRLKHGG